MHIIKFPTPKMQGKKSKIPKSPSQKFITRISNKSFNQDEFLQLCQSDAILQNLNLCHDSLSFLQEVGMDLSFTQERISLATQHRSWMDQEFCFVDIESTDSDPLKGNLLEIGAILCNGRGEVIKRFESFVKNENIPVVIEEITGITVADTQNAPELKKVLQDFRSFLGKSVFVAHNVSFDYHFLDFLYLKHFGIGIYNQSLCTLKIAQKTIPSPRYKLSFLNEFLGIFTPISHRAYADAHTCKEIFFHCKKYFPLGSTQNLLNWASK